MRRVALRCNAAPQRNATKRIRCERTFAHSYAGPFLSHSAFYYVVQSVGRMYVCVGLCV